MRGSSRPSTLIVVAAPVVAVCLEDFWQLSLFCHVADQAPGATSRRDIVVSHLGEKRGMCEVFDFYCLRIIWKREGLRIGVEATQYVANA
jgi:hypothetical protein